ncbi:MAG: hypothetical protein FJ381_11720 [Verrucomicrobia bacterium]|nr:hypothetical protein [Verrucomicrobiota bacterium]
MKNTSSRFPAPSGGHSRADGSGQAPLRVLRLGRVKASIWENAAEDRPYYSVKFTRTYVDEQKQFKDSDSFGRDELLLLAKLADLAHTFVCDQAAARARPQESAA